MSMRKKWVITVVVCSALLLFLAGCGGKSQEKVVSKLEDTMEKMTGYKADATMEMNTGQEEQAYEIDVWYQKDDMYRVSLSNPADEQGNQVILKNEDGVFVLTPALNKSFKFQSEWPEQGSQPYLFQSLVKDVTEDPEATFEETDDHYVFETKTNYQNNHTLPFQKVFFDKKKYTPSHVQVLDTEKEAVVEVKFSNFELDAKFAADDFKLDENMATAKEDVPVYQDEEDVFMVLFPLETFEAELEEKKEVEVEDGERVIMTFAGEKNFTLIQEKMGVEETVAVEEMNGDVVDLGFTQGAMSNNAIEWSYHGVDFVLASEDLTKEELVEVARSVQGKEIK